EDVRDGHLTADVARVLTNVLLAPGPDCVIPEADQPVLMAASAGIPLSELIADFRALCLAENAVSLQPGTTMKRYEPTVVPRAGDPAPRIQDAVQRLPKDPRTGQPDPARVARIPERERAVSSGADILAQFRGARHGLNRVAQVLQSNLLLGAVAAW